MKKGYTKNIYFIFKMSIQKLKDYFNHPYLFKINLWFYSTFFSFLGFSNEAYSVTDNIDMRDRMLSQVKTECKMLDLKSILYCS